MIGGERLGSRIQPPDSVDGTDPRTFHREKVFSPEPYISDYQGAGLSWRLRRIILEAAAPGGFYHAPEGCGLYAARSVKTLVRRGLKNMRGYMDIEEEKG
ncbi:MAG: hypothetical protein ACRDSJ_19090 [Rubrobacteraceae bacterium]